MDFNELLRYRQSTRRFTKEQISKNCLTSILLAANSTPVGSNRNEDVHLTVVQSRDVLDLLAKASIKRWENKTVIKKIVTNNSDDRVNQPLTDPFHGAPTVIFVSHKKQSVQPGIEFSNVACMAYSMHLAAINLGLGSVLMWFALESMRELPELDNTPVLELPAEFEPLIGIAIGHPEKELPVREIKTDKISVNYKK